jgi:hypothetical protein
MAFISTRVHGILDYAGGALMILVSWLPFVRDRRAAVLLRATGTATLAASAATDYELGLWRKIPMPAHLAGDAGGGVALTGAGLLLRRSGAGAGSWLPLAAVGVSQIAGAAVTERTPSDAVGGGAGETYGSTASFTPPATGVTGEGLAATQPAATAAPIAPAPIETPGPSVTPPAEPASETEHAERADALLPEGADTATGDELVAQQEAAAAAEAAAIGGAVVPDAADPAMEPVYQAGGGEQEGYEAAETDLIENATHGDAHGDPLRDAIAPEVEADRSTAVYAEDDTLESTELVADPQDPDDPAAGPGLGADRGPAGPPHQD